MTIFTYDQVRMELILNEPEILLVKEFSELWSNERNIIKTDSKGINKTRTFREFTYMYLMIDWQSHYAEFTEYERNEAAKSDSGITEEEFNDPLFRAACRKYREIQNSSRSLKLVRAAQNKADELIDYFNEGSDLAERDQVTGKPIFKAKDIMGEMSLVGKVLDELDALEERVKKKSKAASGLRAGATDGYTPRNIKR